MIRSVEQLPLAERIPALAQMVTSARDQKEAFAAQEAEYTDMLAKAEAEVTGKAAGSEGVELSGLIEHNPYEATGVDAPPASGGSDTQATDE